MGTSQKHSCSEETVGVSTSTIQPFLKWPGGKRWIAPKLALCIKECLRSTYYEPFLGGGSVFFVLRPQRAVLSDVNGDLVNTYVQVRDHHEEVITLLKELPASREEYYRIRNEEPDNAVERAVRFLYLNRTAFGGIYRLNKDGKFNVPFGGGDRTPEILWRNKLLKKASIALRSANLRPGDFESLLRLAKPGDVVFCDPTYTVSHENNSFRRYNEKNFSWEDQKRLVRSATLAADRGVAVMVTNAYHKCIKELYAPHSPMILNRMSCVSPKVQGRRLVRECVFALGPWPRRWRRHFR
ncbi:MAG: DNA adenine methylase [Desulfobulbaceae bacterium]|nr:DNA adenine methylase [Desulfobulbaceae bacterium]